MFRPRIRSSRIRASWIVPLSAWPMWSAPGDVRRRNRDRVVLRRACPRPAGGTSPLHPALEDALLDRTGLPAGGLLERLAALRVHAAMLVTAATTAGGEQQRPAPALALLDSSDSSTPRISPTRQTSSRSSSISTQTPAEDGKTTWSPGCTGMSTPAFSHQSRPGPTASTIPCWGGGSSVPCGTTSPDRRMRSWSSSLTTTWSNRGRSWCRTVSTGSRDDRVLMAGRIGLAARLRHQIAATSGRPTQPLGAAPLAPNGAAWWPPPDRGHKRPHHTTARGCAPRS